MKTNITAILVILLSSFAFSSCAEEEVTPALQTDEAKADGLGMDDPDF